MPAKPSAAEYWKHAPWFLCKIDNDVRLSPIGQINDTTVIEQGVAYWSIWTYNDQNGNPTNRFEPQTYRSAYLCPNLKAGDLPDQAKGVGIRGAELPSEAAGAWEWYFEDV